MALIKGMLASFADPLLGVDPDGRPLPVQPDRGHARLRASRRSDADQGAERERRSTPSGPRRRTTRSSSSSTRPTGSSSGGPLTTVVRDLAAPRRARDADAAGRVVAARRPRRRAPAVAGGGGAAVPAEASCRSSLFVWGPGRITPVRLKSLTIHETAFDELLNPIHASADLGFTVLRDADLGRERHVRARGGQVLPGRARGEGGPAARPDPGAASDGRLADPPRATRACPTFAVGAPTAPYATLGAPRVVPEPPTAGHLRGPRRRPARPARARRDRRLDPLVAARRREPVARRHAARAARPDDRPSRCLTRRSSSRSTAAALAPEDLELLGRRSRSRRRSNEADAATLSAPLEARDDGEWTSLLDPLTDAADAARRRDLARRRHVPLRGPLDRGERGTSTRTAAPS